MHVVTDTLPSGASPLPHFWPSSACRIRLAIRPPRVGYFSGWPLPKKRIATPP